MISIPAPQPYLGPAMRWPLVAWLLLALLALPLVQRPAPPAASPQPLAAAPAALSQPLAFSPNAGQLDRAVRFQARATGGALFFGDAEVTLTLPAAEPHADPAIVRLQFVGAQTALVEAEQRLPGVINVFSGRDPARWRSGLPRYAALRYRALYPGIDLRYADDGAAHGLHSVYTVAPGADPSRIRWRYAGAATPQIDPHTGALRVGLAGSAQRTLSAPAPIAWQLRDGRRTPVAARYTLEPDGSVGLALGGYDHRQPLTIDPTLDFSSYLGGSGDDIAYAVAVDGQGDAYITGRTGSSDFPTAQPLQPALPYDDCLGDVFVTKWGASGLIYSTYLGGGDCERGEAIAVDAAGSVYLTGTTLSNDFPTSHALQPEFASRCSYSCADTFVAKLSPDGGALVFSSYLGGEEQDTAAAIAVDAAGAVYLTGTTLSNDFPTQQPLQSARLGYGGEPFVVKLSPDGRTLIYSTYLGGSEFETSQGLAVDASGQAIVVGFTGSSDFPTTAQAFQREGGRDAFISKLSADGRSLVFSTYLGGSQDDQARAVALDPSGAVYLTGFTRSTDFPTRGSLQTAAGDSSAFVSKLSPDGRSLVYSTYLGGSNDLDGLFTSYEQESGSAIAVDREGGAYVVGATNARTFPTQHALQPTLAGPDDCGDEDFIPCADAFVAHISPDGGALDFSSYLGGSAEDLADGVAIDGQGRVYITGQTRSDDFPAVQSRYPSRAQDAFVARIRTGDEQPTLSHHGFLPLLTRP
jgi:hypothetical protein